MSETISWIAVGLGALNLFLVVLLVLRRQGNPNAVAEALRPDLRAAADEAARTAEALRTELRATREETARSARESREELALGLTTGNETLAKTLAGLGDVQRAQLELQANQLRELTGTNLASLDRIREVQQVQLESVAKQLNDLIQSNQASLDKVRASVDQRIRELQEGNEKKLEEMRKTVDEKLHLTLEKRLGESFALVSQRLEAVQRGLGEMQNLATGVGDLKRVLTNVKARGTWAEVQLGALLEQILAPGQYERNVRTRDESREVVEFAIRLPGPRDEPQSCVWLPIDSKFPQEDYLRIQDAADRSDAEATQKAVDALARSIRVCAQDIHDKYLNPPKTTDFAIMFLATEGLYAEVLRLPELVDELQQRYRIVIAGPTTLAAILSSIRMGFQTLAIEQRASEVWKVLAGVKLEFARFGDVLDKVKKQLSTASHTIEQTGVRTRAIQKKLRAVEQMPEMEIVQPALQLTSDGHGLEEAEVAEEEEDVEEELKV